MGKKPRGKRGRPTRKAASKAALSEVDVATCDPFAVLKTIASDSSAPASARVAACKALLIEQRQADPDQLDMFDSGDAISRRALVILQGGKCD